MRLGMLVWLCFMCPSWAGAKSPPVRKSAPRTQTPLSLVDRFQSTWDETKTYQASFKQVVYSKRIGTRDETAGVLYVAKPNRLRWESQTDSNVQVLNGKRLISIQENPRRGSRTVDIYKDISQVIHAKPLQFLAGTVKFKEAYSASILSETDTSAELKLIPQADHQESYIAEIDKTSYILRALTTDSGDTRVRIDFKDVKMNAPLDNNLFEYQRAPKDVVHEQ